LPENAASIALAENFWKDGKPVTAICHGPAALVNVKDPQGKNIVSERKVTSFSNVEEEQVGATSNIPFLVETRLIEVRRCFHARSLSSSWAGNMKRTQSPGVLV
jgi:putative intracellular protease/amidase